MQINDRQKHIYLLVQIISIYNNNILYLNKIRFEFGAILSLLCSNFLSED